MTGEFGFSAFSQTERTWGAFGFRSNSIALLITVSIRTAQDPFTVFVFTIFPVLFQIPYPVSKLLSPGMRLSAGSQFARKNDSKIRIDFFINRP